jgi:SAM-dependent methyltransferase
MTTAPNTESPSVPADLDCPVCGTPSRIEESFDDVVLHRCARCDHAFTDVGSLEHLGDYDAAWEALHENWFANPNVELFEFVAKTIESHKPSASVIDIGAGRGELLVYLRDANPTLTLTGVDISLSPDIDGIEVVRADINTVDFSERRWDVAVSLATIEHLADVRTFAARLRSMVTPGGLAIVSTNNERSIPYDVARALYRVGYRVPYERLYDRHHLNHFNTGSLRTLMEQAGLRPLVVRRHNIPLAAVDMPKESSALRLGVWGTFALGKLTGRTFFQTFVLESR